MDLITSVHTSEERAIILGLNVPLLTFGSGIILAAYCFKSPALSSYPRIYNGISFLTLLLLLASIFSIMSVLEPNNSTIYALVSHYFDYAIALWSWWILYDISFLVRGPKPQREKHQRIKYRKKSIGASLFFFVLCFIIFGIISASISAAVTPGMGLVWLNFAPLFHLLIFVMFIKSHYRQIQLLGQSYSLLAVLVIFGNTLGSLLVGILSLTSPTGYPPFYTVSLAQFVITVVMIRYTLVVALVIVLVAFPRSWVYHVRAIEAEFDLVMQPQQQEGLTEASKVNGNNAVHDDAEQQQHAPSFGYNYHMIAAV